MLNSVLAIEVRTGNSGLWLHDLVQMMARLLEVLARMMPRYRAGKFKRVGTLALAGQQRLKTRSEVLTRM